MCVTCLANFILLDFIILISGKNYKFWNSSLRNLVQIPAIWRINNRVNAYVMSRDSSVGIATTMDWAARNWGSIPRRVKRSSSSPQHPDQVWGPPSLLSNGDWGLFPRGWSVRGVKLNNYLHLVPGLRIRGSIHPLPHTSQWRGPQLIKHRDGHVGRNMLSPLKTLEILKLLS
jgi:hypothetical protein